MTDRCVPTRNAPVVVVCDGDRKHLVTDRCMPTRNTPVVVVYNGNWNAVELLEVQYLVIYWCCSSAQW